MFPNHVGQAESSFNHFYSNAMSSSYNQTNTGMYGRHTPHIPHVQTPSNLVPPPPQPVMTWNGIPLVVPAPPHPHHQAPYNPIPNHPPNLLNAQNRQQFNLQGIPPLPCQQPTQLQCPGYGHYGPTSQFLLPLPSFPGGEMFHQGYVTAGGPFSTHHNEGYYHHPMADHNVRQMPNYMPPPVNQMNFNQRPPMHAQQGFGPSPLFDQVIQQGNNASWRNDLLDPQNQYKTMFPIDGHFSQGIFDPLQPPQIHDSFTTDATNQRGFSLHNQSRTVTPSVNILERNTAANFDESSEELAEIFGDRSSQTRQTNPSNTISRSSSTTSSNRTTSSGYIFYSDDDSFDTMDAAMGSTKVFKDLPINQGCTEGLSRDNKRPEPHSVKHTHIRPPPGFAYLKEAECPTEEQLHKVGHIIKGLLKIDVQELNGQKQPGTDTSLPEGNTIRSMIDKPIYSNCESRLIRQETEVQKKEQHTESISVLNNTGQRRYIQRITSHFRTLFEPIPDMFQDDVML